MFILPACSGGGTHTVTTSSWSSTDPVAAAEPDTLDPAADLGRHRSLPAATRTDLRARAEAHVAAWRAFEHAVTVRNDRHFRSWYHTSVSDWTRDHLGVGLGNALRETGKVDPSPQALQQVLTNARYAGYLARQQRLLEWQAGLR